MIPLLCSFNGIRRQEWHFYSCWCGCTLHWGSAELRWVCFLYISMSILRHKAQLCHMSTYLSWKLEARSSILLLQQEWAQGEDEERSSSDGRGSSYFSGERLDQNLSSTASPMHSQQSLTGHIDRATLVCLPALPFPQHVRMHVQPRVSRSEQARAVSLMQHSGVSQGSHLTLAFCAG